MKPIKDATHKALWGFNPYHVLEKSRFPNNRLENVIRKCKPARIVKNR
jgi:hypothetical protein